MPEISLDSVAGRVRKAVLATRRGCCARNRFQPTRSRLATPVKSHKGCRMNSSFRSGACAAVFLALSTFVRAESSVVAFKVGTAKRDITPNEPVPMWGYGARHDALSTGAVDPLYATALVLEGGTNKLAIVGLDLGRSPSEKSLQTIRQRIKCEAGIEHSFIAGSHTHPRAGAGTF